MVCCFAVSNPRAREAKGDGGGGTSSPRCPSHPHRPALMRARSARPPFRSAAGSFQLDHECDSRRGRNDANRNVAICKLAQHTNDSDKAFR
jgi:hypothetical protein